MGKILLTYDLSEIINVSKHSEVKDAMTTLGWEEDYIVTINNIKETWHLPNTALWNANSTVHAAKTDLMACVKNLIQK